MWWWWLLTKGHFVSRVGAEEGKVVVVASQAIPRSHCHIMLIPSTQPYCALLCIPNLIEFLVYNPIYPKQYTPTVQTGEIAVNGWASHRLINPHRHLIIEWILASSTTTVLKPRHLKLHGYLAYPALIFCPLVEVKFLAFYILNLHWSQKLSFWTNSVVLPDIGCHQKLFDYYWLGDVKIQYGKSKFIWWWVISSQV